MLVADSYLGHRGDDAVGDRLAAADTHRVVLSDTDRQRSRVRTETEEGHDLGIVVARELGDGDVLETEAGALVVVELAAVDALVVTFGDADVSPTAALEFGHATGNRHWDLAVRDGEALFPVPDARERMLDALDGDLPDGAATRFERVPPTTFDDAGPADHSHGDHAHGGTDHTHDHGGHSHGHGVRSPGDVHDE